MRIKSLKVQGYKNLVSPVSITDLDRHAVVVIHGLNNVGKSNLLEALWLPFLLLGAGDEENAPLPFGAEQPLMRLHPLTSTPQELFTLGAPTPIEVQLSLTFTDEELKSQGTPTDSNRRELELWVAAYWHASGATWRITRFCFAGGEDAAAPFPPHRGEVAERLRREAVDFVRDVLRQQFVLTHVHRQNSEKPEAPGRGLLTDQLALDLYDAKESNDPRKYLRWEAFANVCAEFGDVLANATPVVTYDRKAGRATLYLQSDAGRLPSHLLGTGVQQVLAIIARMLVSSADVVAVEEPETSVSLGLQGRVRDTILRLTQLPGGPTQVFLTSHSAWFSGTEYFLAVVAGEAGPTVGWRAASDAGLFTQNVASSASPRAPLSYVTAEGYLALPGFVRDHLGVPYGGGVVFHTGDAGLVTVMSNATALAQLGEAPDDTE